MPFYEYECTACKFYVEALQKISDPPLKQCPSCKKQTMKRLVSAPVFRLKGGGWYETDFKSDSEQKRNIHGREEPTESKAADAKAVSAETKAEAKPPAPKAEPSGTRKPATPKPATRAKSKAKPPKRAARKKAGRR
jgi:putative FmdB family regulatory protein